MLAPRGTVVAVLAVTAALAAAADDTAPSSTPKQRLIFATKAAEGFRFRRGEPGKSEVVLHPEPLLRWNNKVVREDDGILFLWTEGNKGRPVASAQFFLVKDQWNHEFQSMSPDRFSARSVGDDNRGWSWEPARGGLAFVRADQIGPPADSASARLRQMKSIAERFTAAVDTGGTFENPEQLRLLTTPIYRYSATEQGILDGALFAFVQGTNPEVLMPIEADATEPAAKVWRYGFARMSCFYLRVHEGKTLVWSVDRAPVPTPDPGSPYFFRASAQLDRSTEMEVSDPPRVRDRDR